MDGIMSILFGTVVLHLNALLQITHGTVVYKNFHIYILLYLNSGGREDVGLLAYYYYTRVHMRDHLIYCACALTSENSHSR